MLKKVLQQGSTPYLAIYCFAADWQSSGSKKLCELLKRVVYIVYWYTTNWSRGGLAIKCLLMEDSLGSRKCLLSLSMFLRIGFLPVPNSRLHGYTIDLLVGDQAPCHINSLMRTELLSCWINTRCRRSVIICAISRDRWALEDLDTSTLACSLIYLRPDSPKIEFRGTCSAPVSPVRGREVYSRICGFQHLQALTSMGL